MTGMWYTRREQSLRYGLWFLGNDMAALFGRLLSYAIGHIDSGLGPLAPRLSDSWHHHCTLGSRDARASTGHAFQGLLAQSRRARDGRPTHHVLTARPV